MLPPGATPIRAITARPSLFPHSFTRCSIGAPYGLPTPWGEQRAYRVPHKSQNGLGPLFPPVVLVVRDRRIVSPCTHHSAILAQAAQHLRLVCSNGVYQAFAYADHTTHSSPYPPDAGRTSRPSRFGWQPCGCGIHCRRASHTGRYLPATPPKSTAGDTAGSVHGRTAWSNDLRDFHVAPVGPSQYRWLRR